MIQTPSEQRGIPQPHDPARPEGAGDPQRTEITQHGTRRERLPHERDESPDSQEVAAAPIRRKGREAHGDATSGREDTDRGLWSEEREADQQAADDRQRD